MVLYCLKCGRKTDEKQVFCDSCIASAKEYPIKPDAVVVLSHRDAPPLRTGPRKRPPTAEERLAKTKLCNRWLIVTVVILGLALSVASAYLVQQSNELQFSQLVGRNYTIQTTPD